jgi:hypothetical protein
MPAASRFLTPVGADGLTHFNALDGSTFNPFTDTLLFTEETSANVNGTINGSGSVIQISMDCLSSLTKLDRSSASAVSRGSTRTMRQHLPDRRCQRYAARRCGQGAGDGTLVPLRAAAQPNTFVYRYLRRASKMAAKCKPGRSASTASR